MIVFGYPQDRYSVTVEYFKSLGDVSEPDLNTEILNCFKIGYRDPGDAMRAVRKNGDTLCGSYMVGVKWAVGLVRYIVAQNLSACRTQLKRKLCLASCRCGAQILMIPQYNSQLD